MKAISIHPIWAGLIADGQKTLEIRSWRTTHRGPLLVCATLNPPCRGVPSGCAVCTVVVADCRPMRPDDEAAAGCAYRPGLHAWVLTHVQRLAKPVPVRGQQRLFEVDLE